MKKTSSRSGRLAAAGKLVVALICFAAAGAVWMNRSQRAASPTSPEFSVPVRNQADAPDLQAEDEGYRQHEPRRVEPEGGEIQPHVGTSQAAEPMRSIGTAAIVTTQPSDAGSQLAEMLLHRSLEAAGLTLVERARLADILREQELSLSALGDGDAAVRFGQMTGADVLVVVEPTARLLHVRMIDTLTGVILAEDLLEQKESPQMVAAGKAMVLQAAAKMQIPVDERIYVSVLGFTPETDDAELRSLAAATETLLPISLRQTGAINLVERQQLARLMQEEALTGTTRRLQGSGLVIEGGLAQSDAAGKVQVVLRLTPAGSTEPASLRFESDADAAAINEAILTTLASRLPSLQDRPAFSPHAEAASLLRRADWLRSTRQSEGFRGCIEAAVALDDRSLTMLHVARLMLQFTTNGDPYPGEPRQSALILADYARAAEMLELSLGKMPDPPPLDRLQSEILMWTFWNVNQAEMRAKDDEGRKLYQRSLLHFDNTLKLLADRARRESRSVAPILTARLDMLRYIAANEQEYCEAAIRLLMKLRQAQSTGAAKQDANWREAGYEEIMNLFNGGEPEGFDIEQVRPLFEWCVENGRHHLKLAGLAGLIKISSPKEAVTAARQLLQIELDDDPGRQEPWQWGDFEDNPEGQPAVDALEHLQKSGELAAWLDATIAGAERSDNYLSLIKRPDCISGALLRLNDGQDLAQSLRIFRLISKATALPDYQQAERRNLISDLRSRIEKAAVATGQPVPPEIYGNADDIRRQALNLREPRDGNEEWVVQRLQQAERDGQIGMLLAEHEELVERLDRMEDRYSDLLTIRLLRVIGFHRAPPGTYVSHVRLARALQARLRSRPQPVRDAVQRHDQPWSAIQFEPVEFTGQTQEMVFPVAYDLQPFTRERGVKKEVFIAWSSTPVVLKRFRGKLVITRSPAEGGPLKVVGRADLDDFWFTHTVTMRAFDDGAGVVFGGPTGFLVIRGDGYKHYKPEQLDRSVRGIAPLGDLVYVMDDTSLLAFDPADQTFDVIADVKSVAPRNALDGRADLRFTQLEADPHNDVIYMQLRNSREVVGVWKYDPATREMERVIDEAGDGMQWYDGNLLAWAGLVHAEFLYKAPGAGTRAEVDGNRKHANRFHARYWPSDLRVDSSRPRLWLDGVFLLGGRSLALQGPYGTTSHPRNLDGFTHGYELQNGGAWVAFPLLHEQTRRPAVYKVSYSKAPSE